MNANLRNFAVWVVIVLLVLALFSLFQNPGQKPPANDVSFSQLLNEVEAGRVREVLIQGNEISGQFTDGRQFQTYAPNDPSLVQRLYGKGVSITARPKTEEVPWFVSLLVSWLPFIALIGVWIFLSRQMQGAGGKAMGFGTSRAKMLTEAHGRVTFEDVAHAALVDLVEQLRERDVLRGGALTRILEQREQREQQQNDDDPEGEVAEIGVHPESFMPGRPAGCALQRSRVASAPRPEANVGLRSPPAKGTGSSKSLRIQRILPRPQARMRNLRPIPWRLVKAVSRHGSGGAARAPPSKGRGPA